MMAYFQFVIFHIGKNQFNIIKVFYLIKLFFPQLKLSGSSTFYQVNWKSVPKIVSVGHLKVRTPAALYELEPNGELVQRSYIIESMEAERVC